MPIRLTETSVAALVVNGKDYLTFDRLLPGFGIRITPIGKRIFIAQGSVAGKKRRLTVGFHPDKTVATARAEAQALLADMRAGRDPVTVRTVRQQLAAAGTVTVAALAERWLAEHVHPKLKPSTARDYEHVIRNHIIPGLGHHPVATLARSDVHAFHANRAGTPRRGNYAVEILRVLMNFAIDLQLRPAGDNPARRIRMFRERKRERFLSETEFAAAEQAIAAAAREGRIGPYAAAGLRLCLLTGARQGEICTAEWAYVDWTRGQVRLLDSKTGPRTIHLNTAALDVLRVLPRAGRFIIAGGKLGQEPGQGYKTLSRAWIIARKYGGLDDVRLHDLRHSYASLAANRGASLQVIGKLLGHRRVTTTARYAHLVDATVTAVNDELGAAITAAIERGTTQPAAVVKLRHRRRR